MNKLVLKIIVPIAIVLIGVAAAGILAKTRRSPQPMERPDRGPLVEVMTATSASVSTVVRGHGEVRPRTRVDVIPQVVGKIVSMHPGMIAGGHFKAGETLVTIDPRDYDLAVERARATVARARVTLDREQAEAEVALQEWNGLHPGEEPTSGLVIREPQVRQAEAELAAAEADLALARLNLERTTLSVPFDGIVETESVDLGQFVTTGRAVATVYGTDVAEVRVPLAERELAWFNVPARPGIQGPPARVFAEFGGVTQHWNGEVVRIEATVDGTSRTVGVVIEVPRPFVTSGHEIPLLPGTFVNVEITGYELDDVISVPRLAVRDGNTVWTVEEGVLRILPVTIVRAGRDSAFISEGLPSGSRVIVSQLDAVTDGMVVRVAPDGAIEGSGA